MLYAALVNPTKLIHSLIALNKEAATTLALRCLEETPRIVDPEIADELNSLQTNVQNQLYQQLETYLKNRQWREADEETYKVMLKVANREEQGWLDVEDIDKFPCEDLCTIDGLWVKYSNGKFGFSVQKEIYKSLGGTREYNEEVFESFGDHLGWRKNQTWMDYNRFTFNLEKAPHAHLPMLNLGWLCFGSREFGLYRIFFSRAKTCKI